MPDPLLVARQAVDQAMALLAGPLPTRPPRPDGVRDKEPHDYVTALDLACERTIAATLRAAFPGDAIAGEEEERAAQGARRVWHVDPVDGTRNLVAGRPEVAVSVALYVDDAPVVGVIGLPYRGLCLSASDEGAWLRGAPGQAPVPLPPLAPPPPRRTLVGLPGELRVADEARAIARLYGALVGRVEGIRVTGALGYDLATVALGELHARASLGAKPMDVAAGVLLVRRLGGVATDTTGAAYRLGSPGVVVGADAAAHALLLDAVRAAGPAAPDAACQPVAPL
ncbi:inositol monophosphatase [Myxococcota bacterium]|nr:inositol monophosphatase [Myxococcota bacterium]